MVDNTHFSIKEFLCHHVVANLTNCRIFFEEVVDSGILQEKQQISDEGVEDDNHECQIPSLVHISIIISLSSLPQDNMDDQSDTFDYE